MKIVIDARFTRTDHHDGISRYGASLIAATAKIADVSMLVSDVRQLRLLPDVPYTLISSPLSPRELFVARAINRLALTWWCAPCRRWAPGAASTAWC